MNGATASVSYVDRATRTDIVPTAVVVCVIIAMNIIMNLLPQFIVTDRVTVRRTPTANTTHGLHFRCKFACTHVVVCILINS